MAGTVCSREDLSRMTTHSVGKVECLLTVDKPVLPWTGVPDGRGGTEALAEQLWDPAAPDAAELLFHEQMKAQVRAVLDTLEAREARVIAMRFGMTGDGGKSLDAVAKTFGMSRDHLRHIEVTAMEKLKHPSQSNALRHRPAAPATPTTPRTPRHPAPA